MLEVCDSPECVIASSKLLLSISPRYHEIDPCEDFHTYACEGFGTTHEIREDQTGIGSLNIISEENQLLLKRILEATEPPHDTSLFWTASSPDREIFAKMQASYNACMNETRLRSLASAPLIDLLKSLDKEYDRNSLTGAVHFLMSIGAEAPITLSVGPDDKDPDTNVVAYSPPYSFGLPSKEYYNKTDLVSSYQEAIGDVLDSLLKEANDSELDSGESLFASFRLPGSAHGFNKKLIHDMVRFESAMAFAGPDPEYLEDITKTYNPHSLDEAEAYNPAISIKAIIDKFAPGSRPSKIVVASPDYLKSLKHIIAAQEKEVLRTYVVWKAVQAYGMTVESEALAPLRKFNNRLQGRAPGSRPERWRTCISTVDDDLPWILSRFFIERAFSKEAKDLGDDIIHAIKTQFIVKLGQTEWMTPAVRSLAISKVGQIRQKIGYPTASPDVTSARVLAIYYANVTVRGDTFFANRLSATRAQSSRSWAELSRPVDRAAWLMSAPTVNAYYNPPGNEIVFPAGIMQAPVFQGPDVPRYLIYGAFGAVAGHELSHAFDSTGANYDPTGNYSDWWDETTLAAFRKKTRCFVDQYANYSIPSANGPAYVNGRLTLGENIADAGGLSAAFQAWRAYEATEGPDSLLPGLQDFSKEQLFFLAYGLTWCGKIREEEAVRRLYTDPHSPAKWRIMGTTSNSREFREAFGCPVRRPTCELW
ncbi:peptidase family M13 [Myriangium duriaei CBS 260.36]|uniref:Peptidase family M13 n=1 Tax=Myriangium duriaei CBS 260.36 TaxID=1168546 RepID=A0A9P4J733_9PEZI|nr:peptidase family M13 [Myriangium duriaei CBS 260.36]